MTNIEDKISLLIPAFLRGELSESEQQEVELHALNNPNIAAEIEFQKNLKMALKHNQDNYEPGELGWAKLSKAMETTDIASPKEMKAPASKVKFWKYAAAILAVASIGQAGILGTIAAKSNQNAQYSYASETLTKNHIVKLGFNPEVNEDTITITLQSNNASIVSGPSSLGLYLSLIHISEPTRRTPI